ncbi:MAG TPA: hypothetical protein VIY73_17160, partial [Polyangiaceae bacterium]
MLVVAATASAALLGCGGRGAHLVHDWDLRVDTGAAEPVRLPARLDRVVGTRARYALHARVELPQDERGVGLELIVPELQAVPALRVDGQELAEADASRVHVYRERGPHVWSIPASFGADGVLDLELDVPNTWTQATWIPVAPRLEPAGASDRAADSVLLLDTYGAIGALVALLLCSFTWLGVFVLDRRR